jgi:chorismate mutase/prephenate dehydrogenase
VVENIRKRATERGTDPVVASAIAKLLIGDAVEAQKAPIKRDLRDKEALVVGGSGRMGQWTCRRLANRGARVRVYDPRGRLDGYDNVKNLKSAVGRSGIIVIASPPGTCSEDLKRVLECAPKGLVIDICSVKSHISSQLRDAAAEGVKIASAHPMFGPTVPTPRGRTIILCNCGSRTGMSLARRLFSGAGANILEMDLERHDELMAYVLGLPHLCALLFGAGLARSREPLNELIDAQGPSFNRMLRISEELSRESVRVYHDIQSLNPNTVGMFSSAERALRDLKKASLSKDHGKFKSIMESNNKYLER